jgi:hypothetical protein
MPWCSVTPRVRTCAPAVVHGGALDISRHPAYKRGHKSRIVTISGLAAVGGTGVLDSTSVLYRCGS